MTIQSIDAGVITDAVLDYLRTVADLTADGSGAPGDIAVGDAVAPNPAVGHPTETAIDRVTGVSDPYLVVYQVPLGLGVDREARSGYSGGTASTTLIRFQISGVAANRQASQRIATVAAARLTDQPYAAIAGLGRHIITRRERIGAGFVDRIGDLHQWTELVDFDISFSP